MDGPIELGQPVSTNELYVSMTDCVWQSLSRSFRHSGFEIHTRMFRPRLDRRFSKTGYFDALTTALHRPNLQLEALASAARVRVRRLWADVVHRVFPSLAASIPCWRTIGDTMDESLSHEVRDAVVSRLIEAQRAARRRGTGHRSP